MDSALVRVAPEQIVCPQENETLPTLAEEAKEYLGYCYGAEVVEYVVSVMSQRQQIREVLIEMDVRPFSPESVEAHKRQRGREAAGPLRCFADRFGEALEIPFILAHNVATLCGVAWGLSWIPSLAGTWGAYCGWTAVGGVTAAVVCCVLRGLIAKVTQPVWRRMDFSEYAAPIPEHVLQTAIDIKKRCRDAVFRIEELVLEKRQLDPCLVLRVPTTQRDTFQYLYLEVWEEPSFSARRIEVADAVMLQN